MFDKLMQLGRKVGLTPRGAAAIVGIGGLAGAGAILYEYVPVESKEAQGAVVGVLVLLGAAGIALVPRARELGAALLAKVLGGKKDGAAS